MEPGEWNPRPVTEYTVKNGNSESSAARDALPPATKSGPATLIDNWADLPEPVRRAILAMVEVTKTKGAEG